MTTPQTSFAVTTLRQHLKTKSLVTLVLLAISLRVTVAESVPQPSPRGEALVLSDNLELLRLYNEDQSDRMPSDAKAIDWKVVGPRDEARELRVKALYRDNEFQTGNDYYRAAMVLQHGHAPEDFLLCHELCFAAIIKGNRAAAWLAAASEDRFLMNIDRPQRFGTQYRSLSDAPMTLYQTDDGVTDALRKTFGVPTLEEAKLREANMNGKAKMPTKSPEPTPSAPMPAAAQEPRT